MRGVIKDTSLNEVLENATVALLNQADHSLLRQTRSSKNGFQFRIPEPGKYIILTTFIGYKSDSTHFVFMEKDSVLMLSPIHLVKADSSLMEVIVRAVIPPVIVKKDTIQFNANSFKTAPNATVEELLKKLPGVEVDKDGNVTVHGKRVEKILVDGKEFFLNDPKFATQNLLAEMLDKVEAYDNKSEMAKHTGIIDVKAGKVLNLKLKADRKRGMFGKVNASYSNLKQPGAGLTVNNFKGGRAFSVATKTSDVRGLFNNSINDPSSLPIGLGQSQSISSSYSDSWGKKVRVNGGVSFSQSGRRNQGISNRQTFLSDSSLLQDKESNSHGTSNSRGMNMSLVYTADTLTTINFSAGAGDSRSENSSGNRQTTRVEKTSQYLLNDGSTENNSNSRGWNANFAVSYSKAFKKRGRYFMASFSNGYNDSKTNGSLLSVTNFSGSNMTRDQRSVQQAKGKTYAFSLTYTEPINKQNIIDAGYSFSYGKGYSKRITNNYDSASGGYTDPDTLASDTFNNKNWLQQWNIGYNHIKEKAQYQIGVSFQRSFQDNDKLAGSRGDISQSVSNIYPRASAIYTISKSKGLTISYTGATQSPSVEQLQPLPDYSNPLLITLGNPSLKQSFSHNVGIGYNSMNVKKSTGFGASLGAGTISNQIVNSTVLNSQGVQEQQFVNINGNYFLSGGISYWLPIGRTKNIGNASFSTGINYGHDKSLLNGIESKRTSFGVSQQARVGFNLGEKFFADMSGGWNYARAKYGLENVSPTSSFNHNYATNVSVVLPFEINFATAFSYTINGKQGSLPARTFATWNLSASKRLFAKKTGSIHFTLPNLLQKNQSSSQVTGNNFIEISQSNVRWQLYTISFSYKFNRFKKSKK